MVPFANLEPVQVTGVTVKLATLHNEEDLRRKDVRDGDEVIVTRAGDVIPQVISPTAKAQRRKNRSAPPEPPKECPRCGTPTMKPEDGVWTICPNFAGCPGQVFQRIKHFVYAMDIDGFGEETVIRFLNEGLIASVADIYELTEERLTALDGFGEVSARNLLASIEQSKQQPFYRVLASLSIPGIGGVNARGLAAHFRSVDALMKATPERVAETPGIGPILAETIAQSLSDERMRELIERLRGHGLKMVEEGPAPGTEGPLAGKTFVITGTLPGMSREKATAAIEAAGGKVTNSVSRRTDFLVAGSDPGSKLAKAQELGTAVLAEDGILELLPG
jgi:DNA ligase (NAD+)